MTTNVPESNDETPVDETPVDDEIPTLDESALCAYTDYREGPAIEDLPATGEDADGVERDVWETLYAIEDPEMPVSIVDLGLIYGVEVEDGLARIDMTLTYSGCPARDMLTTQVEEDAAAVDGVDEVEFRLVWSPEWSLELVTDQGKADLKEFGLSV